jgi:hypothetical protein
VNPRFAKVACTRSLFAGALDAGCCGALLTITVAHSERSVRNRHYLPHPVVSSFVALGERNGGRGEVRFVSDLPLICLDGEGLTRRWGGDS